MSKLIEKYPFLAGHEDIVQFALDLNKKTGLKGFWFTNEKREVYTVGRPTKKIYKEHINIRRWK